MELDAQGNKTLTNVYTGEAVLAEQRVFTPTIPNEVLWKPQDTVTGSYQKTRENGEKAYYVTPPSNAEIEPLGGIVPEQDPYYDDFDIMPPNARYGGDVFQPETGCAWDGTPIRCDMISSILRYSGQTTINVNTRAPGGYSLYHSLRSNLTTRRQPRYLTINNEDARIGRELSNDRSFWSSMEYVGRGNYRMLIGYSYEMALSSFAETLISRQDYFENRKLTEAETERLKKGVNQIVDDRKCSEFLEKAYTNSI